MIYNPQYPKEYDTIPTDKPIWAYAYDVNNETEHARTRCKPILGEINFSMFYPYKKGTTERMQRGVSKWSRSFADTEEEAKQAYNALVMQRIDKLYKTLETAKQDIIP